MSADPTEVALLAEMAYGESYYKENNFEEMAGIASVLVRQRDARGYPSMQAFTAAEPSYSFVTHDGNRRFAAISKFTESDVDKKISELKLRVQNIDNSIKAASSTNEKFLAKLRRSVLAEQASFEGFKMAFLAAKNALEGGADYSNGAYFWDGWDIKTNYSNHAKVARGIKIIAPEHNIFSIKDNLVTVIKYRVRITTSHGKSNSTKEEVGRYDHVYESTAARGGTIFWRFNTDYIKVENSKVYK